MLGNMLVAGLAGIRDALKRYREESFLFDHSHLYRLLVEQQKQRVKRELDAQIDLRDKILGANAHVVVIDRSGTVRLDVPGALYLAATAAFVVIVTWALVPLVIPALGCAALAVVAVPERPRRHAG